MTDILNMMGAIATMMMGAMGLFAPKVAAGFTGLKAVTSEGQSEFRATYGGLFIGLGGLAIFTLNPYAFATAALAWFGAAAGRLISILLDQTRTTKNMGAVMFEAAFGVALIVGVPWNTVF